ncbi:MAG: hypothetical protein ACKVOL_00040 [Novosphingobium sp.]
MRTTYAICSPDDPSFPLDPAAGQDHKWGAGMAEQPPKSFIILEEGIPSLSKTGLPQAKQENKHGFNL